ncbi:hypothetical protein [Rhizobium sp. BK176]|uniref:hypothetical protein n=1 Tax=Rhizobium sp. BK176 TaxID=2587071 RepID=UPI00216851AB|nr:hypothetical protein [Rhizobium sp. BK176]MCS4089626.1 hypothetical protein [Rhizobium sp. BK176]
MIVNVPFKYEVEGRREGRQRNGTYDVWEIAEMDLRVVSPEDAPVAVSWDDRLPDFLRIDQYAAAEWGSHSVDGSAHTVHFENSHWVALNEAENRWAAPFGAYGPLKFDDLIRRIETHGECPVLGPYGFDSKAKKQVEACRNDGHYMFDDIKKSNRDYKLRQLIKKASPLIVVGDRLYRKCLEPRLWIMKGTVNANRTTAGESYHVALVRVTTDHEHEQHHRRIDWNGRKAFGLNEIDVALSHAAEFNKFRYNAPAADARNKNARPVITHIMAFDEAAHLRGRIHQLHSRLVDGFLRVEIGQTARSTLRCFVDLDEGLLELKTATGLARYEEAALRIQKDLSNPHNNQHNLLRFADELVEVLENRNIDIGDEIAVTTRNSL